MPRYVYHCKSCSEHFEVYHGMSEDQKVCVFCSTVDPHRVPQMPFLKSSIKPKPDKVGEKTKAAIEENRAILEEAKKEAKRNYYDNS